MDSGRRRIPVSWGGFRRSGAASWRALMAGQAAE
jgi:hypothetical protein